MTHAGLLDLQVNGFAGVDFNAGSALTADAVDHALEAMLATGVTACLPTIITATPTQLAERFAALDTAIAGSRLGPLMCPGYHLEGPFLNPEPGYAGCHPPEAMTDPDYRLVQLLEHGLSRPILLVTIAAELPGAGGFTRQARAAGKLVALGHSAVTFEQAAAAAAEGAGLSTHLGNGLPHTLHKLANPLFAQLAEDRLTASFIADGIHILPAALRVLIRAKGPGRSILVTDAVAAAAAPAGLHPFAGMTVERTEVGAVRLPGGTTLAGSALCLDQAVRNMVAWGIADPDEALAMASTRPAALLAPALAAHGIARTVGRVEWSADLRPIRAEIGSFSRRLA